MGISVCPSAIVAAPLETVWEEFSDPTIYDEWWEARTQRIEPEGKAVPGQMIYARAGRGIGGDVTIRVETVNPEKHQLQLVVNLPLGMVNHATLTANAIDAATTRIQFG